MYRDIPNALTIARFPLALLFLVLHLSGWRMAGLAIAVLGCVTDWADGYLARKWNVESEFGKNVDPYADKFICWILTFIVLSHLGYDYLFLPVVVVIFAYDVGLFWVRYVFGRKHIPTNSYAKWKTTSLMTGLLTFYTDSLLGHPAGRIGYWIGITLGWIALWYALRSAANYLRGYGWGHALPRPLHLL